MKKILFIIIFSNLSFIIAQKNSSKVEYEIEKSTIENYKKENELLKEKINNHIDLMSFFLAGFGILFTISLGASVYYSNKNEKRASEAFESYNLDNIEQKQRSTELYNMFIEDKRKSEQEANIDSTDKTIGLVNKTLKIAIEASRSASKKVQKTYQETFEKIEKDCIRILDEADVFNDDKNLTLNREILIQIHKLGEKSIRTKDNSIFIDQDRIKKSKRIVLLPHSVFIKGTEEYLKEQFDDALETWNSIINLKGKNDEILKLKSLTYFWIGYLNNNLNKFGKGIENFTLAKKNATPLRTYELERLIIETQFFNKQDLEIVKNNLINLQEKISNDNSLSPSEKESKLSKILNTLGNVHYDIARNSINDDEKNENYELSIKTYLKILDLNLDNFLDDYDKLEEKIKIKNKWAIFGLAESMYNIKIYESRSIKIFEDDVIRLADDEYKRREEKRTKILAKTCQLISYWRIGNQEDRLNQAKMEIDILCNDFNKKQTLFSQFERKNVSYEVFKESIDKITTN